MDWSHEFLILLCLWLGYRCMVKDNEGIDIRHTLNLGSRDAHEAVLREIAKLQASERELLNPNIRVVYSPEWLLDGPQAEESA